MTNKPTFFIVGAAKAGTTALHNTLCQHPAIFLPKIKETNYFSFKDEIVDFKGPLDDQTINKFSITRAEDYFSLFSSAQPNQICGEACPSYLYFDKAAQEIRDYLPSAKIVIVLRNPTERAFSNYLHLVRDGRETLSFSEALQAEVWRHEQHWEWFWEIFNIGLYSGQVERYYSLFPRENILILLYDDYRKDPSKVLCAILDFIGVDSSIALATEVEHNKSGRPLKWVEPFYRMMLGPTLLNYFLRKALPASIRKIAGDGLKKLFTKPEKLNPAIKSTLMEGYSADISRLEVMTGLDLRAWRS